MNDQLRRINSVRNRAAVLSLSKLKDQAGEHVVLDKTNIDDSRLKNAGYDFIFFGRNRLENTVNTYNCKYLISREMQWDQCFFLRKI